VITWGLAAVCVLVFLGELAGATPERWLLVPADITHGVGYGALLTSMFLHGGWGHLIGNLMYLIIFGNNVEDALGRVRYLLFYLACGAVAALAQVAANPLSTVPMVGASGAIAGVLGAYLLLFPRARVDTLVLGLVPVNVPAWVVLGLWILSQFFLQLNTMSVSEAGGGVAYIAHIGGFVAGLLGIRLLAVRRTAR
jgi:membrane associated rhomboid family serine protease